MMWIPRILGTLCIAWLGFLACLAIRREFKMKSITSHRLGMGRPDPLNDRILIEPVGQRSAGGASSCYHLHLRAEGGATVVIPFQDGNPNGVINGVSNEALIAIVMDRCRDWQDGPFPHDKNAEALGHLAAAMKCFHDRALERIERGVQGEAKP